MMIRCPICPTFLVVRKIYDCFVSMCDNCGYSEPFAKKEDQAA